MKKNKWFLPNPENVTDDMAGWLIILEINKASLEGCTSFDAIMK